VPPKNSNKDGSRDELESCPSIQNLWTTKANLYNLPTTAYFQNPDVSMFKAAALTFRFPCGKLPCRIRVYPTEVSKVTIPFASTILLVLGGIHNFMGIAHGVFPNLGRGGFWNEMMLKATKVVR